MKVLTGKYITDVSGFMASGISSGVKKSGKKDLGLLYSKKPCVAAATFTSNKAKAAPIYINIEHLEKDFIQGIIVNSGNANACTGNVGLENARSMVEETAKGLRIPVESVLVSSTGIIGLPLDMEKILPGIKKACKEISTNGGKDMAMSILTTDTFIKTVTVEINLGGKDVRLSGIAKGSGMIHPNMATMLSFIVTNANISKEHLNKLFKESVEDSYNMVSVDGDTSTNDMAVILANGTAENLPIEDNKEYSNDFKKALNYVNKELAKMIAKDGEGATRLIEVSVINAKSKKDAKEIARSVVSSNLVKTAIFGSDANWGRIMCAIGYAKANCEISKVDLLFKNSVGELKVVENGQPIYFDESYGKKILEDPFVNITINLKEGNYEATAWGCDLTYDYVRINGEYRS